MSLTLESSVAAVRLLLCRVAEEVHARVVQQEQPLWAVEADVRLEVGFSLVQLLEMEER